MPEITADNALQVEGSKAELLAALEKLNGKLTGFVVHDAGMAVGVLKAVEEAGLSCPKDVSGSAIAISPCLSGIPTIITR